MFSVKFDHHSFMITSCLVRLNLMLFMIAELIVGVDKWCSNCD